jgi:hypothetical protein
MVSEREAIAIVWVMGIGLAALLSSAMLVSSRTKNWSELRIAACSLGISVFLIASLLYLIGG